MCDIMCTECLLSYSFCVKTSVLVLFDFLQYKGLDLTVLIIDTYNCMAGVYCV